MATKTSLASRLAYWFTMLCECRCRSPWCYLDSAFACKWGIACNKHDAHIRGES